MKNPGLRGKRDPQTYDIIGAAMEVHRTLGHGFLEAVYHEALAHELQQQHIPFEAETPLPIIYKGFTLTNTYRADFICYDTLIVELKASASTSPSDKAQVLNYLKASGHRKGLLINFGAPSLSYERIVLNYSESASSAESADPSSAVGPG